MAAQHPSSSLVWAVLAEDALRRRPHDRGLRLLPAPATTAALDSLRKSGWRGQGPMPWSHEPNRGFLRSLAALSRAAGAISETPEQRRCADFLRDSSREGAEALGL